MFFKEAGAFGPRLLEILHPLSATFVLPRAASLAEGGRGEAEERFSATC